MTPEQYYKCKPSNTIKNLALQQHFEPNLQISAQCIQVSRFLKFLLAQLSLISARTLFWNSNLPFFTWRKFIWADRNVHKIIRRKSTHVQRFIKLPTHKGKARNSINWRKITQIYTRKNTTQVYSLVTQVPGISTPHTSTNYQFELHATKFLQTLRQKSTIQLVHLASSNEGLSNNNECGNRWLGIR